MALEADQIFPPRVDLLGLYERVLIALTRHRFLLRHLPLRLVRGLKLRKVEDGNVVLGLLDVRGELRIKLRPLVRQLPYQLFELRIKLFELVFQVPDRCHILVLLAEIFACFSGKHLCSDLNLAKSAGYFVFWLNF